jgi:hypothetical protein
MTAHGREAFLHDDAHDRPTDVFGGVTTLHFGGGRQPYLLLPIVPPKKEAKKRDKTRG